MKPMTKQMLTDVQKRLGKKFCEEVYAEACLETHEPPLALFMVIAIKKLLSKIETLERKAGDG